MTEDLGANRFNIQVIFLTSTSTTNSISCPHAYCSFVAIVTVFPYSFYRLSPHLTPFWFAFFIIPSDLVMLCQGSNQNTTWHLILSLDIDSDLSLLASPLLHTGLLLLISIQKAVHCIKEYDLSPRKQFDFLSARKVIDPTVRVSGKLGLYLARMLQHRDS